MMIRTRGRRLVARLEALERIYDTRGPRVFRVIFEYGGEPTIVTIYRDENRTEIIEPLPPDDDPDEFFGAAESTGAGGAEAEPGPSPPGAQSAAAGRTIRPPRTPTRQRNLSPIPRRAANASLSIRRGTACRAQSPPRTQTPPLRAVRANRELTSLEDLATRKLEPRTEVRGPSFTQPRTFLIAKGTSRHAETQSHEDFAPPQNRAADGSPRSRLHAATGPAMSRADRNSRHSKTLHPRKTEPRTRASGQHPGDKRAAILFTQRWAFLVAEGISQD